MHYTFPKIVKFSDIEEYLDDNFRVTEQSGVKFINYNLSNSETFPAVNSYGDAVRREFRGIAFDAEDGYILSRPFHKFFNLDERPDEQPDWSIPHVVLEKLDGSMVRPIRYPSGNIRWCTKAGVTDVAAEAEVFVAKHPRYERFAQQMLDRGLTPIFEYVGPNNKIVLDYSEENLVLLAIRNMVTGDYVNLNQPVVNYLRLDIPVVGESTHAVHEVKDSEGDEGIVISFYDGHKVKVKSEWYVLRHKGKELISNERKVVKMILDGTIDDVLPFVSGDHRKAVWKFQEEFNSGVDESADLLQRLYAAFRSTCKTKKEVATSSVLTHFNPWVKSAIFSLWDEKVETPKDAILKIISKSLSTEDKYRKIKRPFQLPDLGEN